MSRTLRLFFCLMLAAVWGFAADPTTVKVMTQNLDAGTDLTYAVAELTGLLPPGQGVDLTYQEVVASDIPHRMTLLAQKISQARPDLLALEEATLWRTGPSVDDATVVLADQLDLLLAALAHLHVPYDIVAVNQLSDFALPRASGGALRMTDRDALLVRSDLMRPRLRISDVHSQQFQATYSLGGLQVVSGWITAMVHVPGRQFRLAITHLESPVPGDPTAVITQTAQANELIQDLRNSMVPVVIAGDFNSDAISGLAGPGPDNTSTVALIEGAGYLDAWKSGGAGIGPTWPIYLEDQFPPPPFFGQVTPFERIDLIFMRGLNSRNVEQVIAPNTPANSWPYFGSDHAGVIATFRF